MFLIENVINNNSVLCKINNQETILMGKGIGFKKKRGDYLKLEEVDKIDKKYLLTQKSDLKYYINLLENTDEEVIELVQSVIDEMVVELSIPYEDIHFYQLLDHIGNSINKNKVNINIEDKIDFTEIENFKEEISFAKRVINNINEKLKIKLPNYEYFYLTKYFISFRYGSEVIKIDTDDYLKIKEVNDIIKEMSNVDITLDSYAYTRFIIHLKYFFLRQEKNVSAIQNNNCFNLNDFKVSKNIENIITELEKYFFETYQWNLTEDEKVYLLLHLKKLLGN